MTEHPGQWGSQGGYPPRGPGGYPPQQPGGYPPQQPAGYPPQQGLPASAAGSRRAIRRRRGLCTPSRLLVDIRLSRQGVADLRGQQLGGGPGPQGGPAKKSPVMIIAIVAAAIVLLAAVGGIIMVLTRGGGGEQPSVTITPSQPVPPTEQPTEPTGQPTTPGTAAHTHRDIAAADLVAASISATGSSSTGQRLGGQEDRQERGAAVRREGVFLGQSLQISVH